MKLFQLQYFLNIKNIVKFIIKQNKIENREYCGRRTTKIIGNNDKDLFRKVSINCY
jgi:hypothetical protein